MVFDFKQEPGKFLWDKDYIKTEKPLVSIITPYYNGKKHIQQTCNCVLNQTFPYFEWIIVDDGSTNEEDVQFLEEIRKQDPRIKVLHKDNGGISSARNYGIKASVTDYILPLDGDDLLEPTFVEYCWWMLQKNPEAAWAYTTSLGFQGQEYLWNKYFDPELLKFENHLTATALIKKDVLNSIGCYSEVSKHYNEDWYAWLKIIAKGGYPVQSCGEYLFWYRRNDTGVLSKVQKDKNIARENAKLISSAAKSVENPKAPVIYPRRTFYNWEYPVLSSWDKCVYKEKTKNNIAFLFPHLEMGGADKFNVDLISGLPADKYNVGIITTNNANNEWIQNFRKLTPEIFNLANFVEQKDYAEFISYYIKSRNVDILFVSNSYHGYYLVPWLRQNFPDLVIVDYVHMEEWYWRKGGYARSSGAIAEVTEKTYVCNSATEKVMVEHFNRKPETVKTVHIGVDEQFFDRNVVESGQLYKELGISSNRPVVLFICRLHPQKRPFLMLEIAQKVVKENPDIVFAVVGSGPQEDELKETVKKLNLSGNIFFLGSRKDVRPYYKDAKVTLVCSLKEGLSLTAYESCSMGVPVVSADVGGQKDLIDGTVGALIECNQEESSAFDDRNFSDIEVAEYAKAIIKLTNDEQLWKTASENCRKKIENGFTISNMVRYFDQEFRNLLNDADAKSKRNHIAEILKAAEPMAAELFMMEMQFQSAENDTGINILSRYSVKDIIKKGSKKITNKAKGYVKNKIKKCILRLKRTLRRL